MGVVKHGKVAVATSRGIRIYPCKANYLVIKVVAFTTQNAVFRPAIKTVVARRIIKIGRVLAATGVDANHFHAVGRHVIVRALEGR